MNKHTYSSNKPHSLGDKAAFSARKKIYNKLASKFPIMEMQTILDVGVTADRTQDSSNFFEKLYPYTSRITALSDQDASWMTEKGMQFVKSDALDMPFDDDSFDLVFSSATIEHVGCRANQLKFVSECLRVAKKYVFITTPNRYYPIELHTALPLIHWLPPNVHRGILNHIGKQFFASERNLNLLSRKDLTAIMHNIGDASFEITAIRFLGFESNLLLMATK